MDTCYFTCFRSLGTFLLFTSLHFIFLCTSFTTVMYWGEQFRHTFPRHSSYNTIESHCLHLAASPHRVQQFILIECRWLLFSTLIYIFLSYFTKFTSVSDHLLLITLHCIFLCIISFPFFSIILFNLLRKCSL